MEKKKEAIKKAIEQKREKILSMIDAEFIKKTLSKNSENTKRL